LSLRSGASMPLFGLGTWELTDDTAGTVAYALELGYRMIDTAVDYGSQQGIGVAIRRGIVDRAALYIVAKVEETDDAYEAAGEYLGEIGIEYADLMLIHRPPEEGVGVPLWRGLQRARKERLTRDIGVSNYSIEQMEVLEREGGELPVVNQIEWTPFGYSERMLAFCQRRGVLIQAYSPLTRAERLEDPKLLAIARRCGKTPAQVLIRWNLQRGTVPLPKANRKEHLQENVDVFDFELAGADMSALNDLNERYSALGSLPYE
jgi:diketogulonate reductase-like aldo/keto reductase